MDSDCERVVEPSGRPSLPSPPPGVDAEVWRELPEEIRLELVAGSPRNVQNGEEVSNKDESRAYDVDNDLLNKRRRTLKAREGSPKPFYDAHFPPANNSLVGAHSDDDESEDDEATHGHKDDDKHTKDASPPMCRCQRPARLLTVHRLTQNFGRLFYGCATRTCEFFAWCADEKRAAAIQRQQRRRRRAQWRREWPQLFRWRNFAARDGWIMLRQRGEFHADDVQQGSVGDCWFLSALAVIATRPDLIDRVVLQKKMCESGKYGFRLCLDGVWEEVHVDAHLPVKREVRSSAAAASSARRRAAPRPTMKGTAATAFARPVRSQLWAPLLEKAYAKAHGSYAAIIGGEVREAMRELSGVPCETLFLDTCRSPRRAERIWQRLLSFVDAHFPMGAATMFGGSGLVQTHAYSVLDVREVHHVAPAKQTSMRDFVTTTGPPDAEHAEKRRVSSAARAALPAAASEPLRVVRLRNPWGRREWSGAWGESSELWTPALRRLLPRGDKNDGTFWMSYDDFLQRFALVDVCKAHLRWHEAEAVTAVVAGEHVVEARHEHTAWAYVTYVQRSVRRATRTEEPGGTGDGEAAARRRKRRPPPQVPLSVLIVRRCAGGEDLAAVDAKFCGAAASAHCELILDAHTAAVDGGGTSHIVVPIDFGAQPSPPAVFRIFSSTAMTSVRRLKVDPVGAAGAPRTANDDVVSGAAITRALHDAFRSKLRRAWTRWPLGEGDRRVQLELYTDGRCSFVLALNRRADRDAFVRVVVEEWSFIKYSFAPWDDDSLGVLAAAGTARLVVAAVPRMDEHVPGGADDEEDDGIEREAGTSSEEANVSAASLPEAAPAGMQMSLLAAEYCSSPIPPIVDSRCRALFAPVLL